MKKSHQIAALGCLAAAAGVGACWRRSIRMPLREFTRSALYMAVMDDEICRNELAGSKIGDTVITFPPKDETLQERYHLFLQMNRTKNCRQLQGKYVVTEKGGPLAALLFHNFQQSRRKYLPKFYAERPHSPYRTHFFVRTDEKGLSKHNYAA